MDAENITALATVGTLVVAIIGLIVAGRRFYTQNRLDFYEKYTKRCSDIMAKLPLASFMNMNATFISREEFANFQKNFILYFDLCSEEYYLAQNGYIDQKVWNEWREGMAGFFNRDVNNVLLQEIVIRYKDAYPDFIDFLKYELQIKNL